MPCSSISLLIYFTSPKCMYLPKSRYLQLGQGILQGSKLSPLMFIGLIDWALKQGPEVIKGLKTIFVDDFLILCLIRDREQNMQITKKKLAYIGLSLSDFKSYDIVNDFNNMKRIIGQVLQLIRMESVRSSKLPKISLKPKDMDNIWTWQSL